MIVHVSISQIINYCLNTGSRPLPSCARRSGHRLSSNISSIFWRFLTSSSPVTDSSEAPFHLCRENLYFSRGRTYLSKGIRVGIDLKDLSLNLHYRRKLPASIITVSSSAPYPRYDDDNAPSCRRTGYAAGCAHIPAVLVKVVSDF